MSESDSSAKPPSQPKGSFSQGVGRWIGAAEVYGPEGTFLGAGRDTRKVEADDGAGTVTVNVSFDGPFSLGGVYTIADRGTHRLYQGPLNYGFADVLGDGLIAAHNYWSDIGMSQRFFLMVLPDGSRQLSLALISRGEILKYVVVGEYHRVTDDAELNAATDTTPPEPIANRAMADRAVLLHRPGVWSGQLTVLDEDLRPAGSTAYRETLTETDEGDDGGDGVDVAVEGMHFAPDATFSLIVGGNEAWTPRGDVLGSLSLSGGRGQSGVLLHHADEARVWQREVCTLDGSLKGVVHMWYRGEKRVGAAYGVLTYEGV